MFASKMLAVDVVWVVEAGPLEVEGTNGLAKAATLMVWMMGGWYQLVAGVVEVGTLVA